MFAHIHPRRTRRHLTTAIVVVVGLTALLAPAAQARPTDPTDGQSTFSGTVVDGHRHAITNSGLTVSVNDSAGDTGSGSVQPDGSFSLSVPSGLYTMSLSGDVQPHLGLNVSSADSALDLSSDVALSLVLPLSTLTSTVTDVNVAPVAGAQQMMVSPGCANSSFVTATGLTVSGTWDEGTAAPSTSDANGIIQEPILPCAVPTKYNITPPDGSSLKPVTVTIAKHAKSAKLAAGLYPPVVDIAASAGLAEVTHTWAAHPVDYNVDGLEDVWIGYHQHSGKVWQNNGDGTYSWVAQSAFPMYNSDGTRTDRHDCAWADVDLNGLPDAYCAAGRDKQNYVKSASQDNELWLQLTPGNFTDVGTEWGLGDPCGRGRNVAFLDVNGDGYPDLFFGNEAPRNDPKDPCANPANNLPNSRSKLFINMGGTGFRYAPEYLDPGYVGQRCAKVLDFNGDGWPDLLTCNNKGQPPSLFRNDDGTGFTEVSAQVGLTYGVSDVDLIDLNGDGTLDVLSCSTTAFSYQLNDGGTFGSPVLVYQSKSSGVPESVAAADVDGDGDLDIYAMYGHRAGKVNGDDVLLINRGNGYTPLPVPSATGIADHVVALHPYGPTAPAAFLVLNGYQDDHTNTNGGPIQLITLGT